MRLTTVNKTLVEALFQSTHPRGMRHESQEYDEDSFNFNPRIREGCDVVNDNGARVLENFNPRIREGCDNKDIKFLTQLIISIHASARDATINTTFNGF